MTASPTNHPLKMTGRKCRCPIYASQDGLCGCREYWERKNSCAQRLGSPSTTPLGPPREICFFWYHGTCRRGYECKLAHESHITWPMTPPPGFIHFEPCDLPLCPLRHDLVAFKDSQMRRKRNSRIGGQLDGAAMSYLSRNTPVTTSSDDSSLFTSLGIRHQDEGPGRVVSNPLIDPSSKPLNGSYSDTSNSESGGDEEERAHEVSVDPRGNRHKSCHTNAPISLPPLTRNMDYFDLSGYAPMPPSSDTEEKPVASLSHAGTLGKRKQNTPPPKDMKSRRTRAKREPAPEHSGFVSSMELTRSLSHWDIKPSGSPDELSEKLATQSTSALEKLPPRAATPTAKDPAAFFQTDVPPDPRSFAPKGPRALEGGSLVCFYWYHKGHCRPKRKNGRNGRCAYAHALDGPHPQVSLPPGINNHDPDCSLPLCPVHLTATGPDTNDRSTSSMTMNIKDEPVSPPKYGLSSNAYSSSPRKGIPEARAFVKGPKYNHKNNSAQLPKLTGAKRERFKMQKRAVEEWQAENGIKPYDRNNEIEAKRGFKKMKQQLKQERRKSRSHKTQETTSEYASNGIPAKRPSKKSKRARTQRRAGELFERDAASAGAMETFDPKAELHKDSFQPISGFPEHAFSPDGQGNVQDRKQNVARAMGLAGSLTYSAVPSSPHSLDVTQRTNSPDHGDGEPLSDESRLDWDTDEVRRLFGGF
ncbi:hypothetical protein BDU57DRAFT_517529, partial [Ampelomyces quisqualis]